MSGVVDVQVSVSLVQITLSACMAACSLCGLGFAAALIFVRRTECHRHIDGLNVTICRIFEKIESLQRSLNIMVGQHEVKK
jgi:hypothetical protein